MTTWRAVLVLLRANAQITRNTLLRRAWWKIALLLVPPVVVGWFAYGLYIVSGLVVRGLRSREFAEALQSAAELEPTLPAINPEAVLFAVPSVLLFVASLLLVLSSFSSVLSSLYLSGDMDMLLTKPVPMRAVFIVKFFSGLMAQYLLLFILLAPVLVGYGNGMGYGALYIIVAVLVLLLLPLLPIGLGALLVMAVVRVIPAHRAREIVSVLGGLVAISFYVLTQFAPEIAPQLADVSSTRALLQLQLPIWPSAWAGRALVAAGEGSLLTLAAYGGLFVLLSVLVFVGCVLLAEYLYYVGWSNVAVQSGRVRHRQQATDGAEEAKGERFALLRPWELLFRRWAAAEPQSAAVFLKDWRIFPRDMRNVQQLIFPLALVGIWVFRLLTMPEPSAAVAPGSTPDGIPGSGLDGSMLSMDWLMGLSSIAITYFLCFTIASTIASVGISREGRTFWLLKLSPVSNLRLLLGKLVLAYLPYLLVGAPLLALLTVLGSSSLLNFLTGMGVLLLIGLGNTCLSLGLGAAFPRLNWENPQQQTTFIAGCLSLLLSPLYIGLMLAAVFGPPALAGLLGLETGITLLLTALGWLLALLLTVLVAGGSLYLGSWGLDRIDL
jgi:ABC-2 type transport system permease protein